MGWGNIGKGAGHAEVGSRVGTGGGVEWGATLGKEGGHEQRWSMSC